MEEEVQPPGQLSDESKRSMMSNGDFQSVVKQGHALASLEASKTSHSLTDLSFVAGGQALPSQAPLLNPPSIEIEEAKTAEPPEQKESMDDKEKGEEEQMEGLAEDRQEEVLLSHAISSGEDLVGTRAHTHTHTHTQSHTGSTQTHMHTHRMDPPVSIWISPKHPFTHSVETVPKLLIMRAK